MSFPFIDRMIATNVNTLWQSSTSYPFSWNPSTISMPSTNSVLEHLKSQKLTIIGCTWYSQDLVNGYNLGQYDFLCSLTNSTRTTASVLLDASPCLMTMLSGPWSSLAVEPSAGVSTNSLGVSTFTGTRAANNPVSNDHTTDNEIFWLIRCEAFSHHAFITPLSWNFAWWFLKICCWQSKKIYRSLITGVKFIYLNVRFFLT